MDIIIVGAGGLGREVLWLIQEINKSTNSDKYEVIGFVDDNQELHGQIVNDVSVIGPIECLKKHPGVAVSFGIGDPQVKKQILTRIARYDLVFPNIIAPDLISSNYISLGQGNIISFGNIITVQVEIGDFNLINLGCTIGHDVKIGTGVTLSPNVNLSGFCTIKDFSDLGTNAKVIPGKSIGQNCIIGAGSVVIRDIPDGVTAVGCPTRPIN